MKFYWVYIVASEKNSTLYIGMTNNLIRRIYEHKNNVIKGFTKKYNVHKLVYIEQYERPEEALYRESQLKAWRRTWKLELIDKTNPEWKDLYLDLI
ncbi:MAG: GIY-YIG nuclease family protein [Alphaproteobacteria bacterium]|nr:GIY-YIG nuclease family protein [Alphaproteobacteria bacterium]